MNLNEIYNEPIKIEESEKGLLKFNALFCIADEATRNNNVYPSEILKKAVKAFNERLDQMNVSFRSHNSQELPDASHILTRAWMQDNKAYVEGKVLPTAIGRDVKAILNGGGRIGVSLRGTGTVQKRDGKNFVDNNFQILGVDLALSPGVEGATMMIGESYGAKQNQLNKKQLLKKYEYAKKTGYPGNFQQYQELMKKKNG
jgi:hypothetical protein